MSEKILIIDDDVETLRLIGLMLQRQGFEIVSLDNGKQALVIAKNEKPDLIVLDVMMPEMDGYQVTRELRNDPELTNTPILMFTAKSQVDDKVAGYEAGVDDYLTKPVHPAELTAHIKALLSRTRVRPATVPTPSMPAGFILGIVSPRGGMGVSTLALNLAASYAKITKSDVIAAELKPGQGTWALDLGMANNIGLHNLLKLKPGEISTEVVEQNLINTSFGVRILFSSQQSLGIDYSVLGEQQVAIIKGLAQLSPLVILDLGNPLTPGFVDLCALCKTIIVITEPQQNTVTRTLSLIEEIRSMPQSTGRTIDLVLYNRTPSSLLMSSLQVSELLNGTPVAVLIPPGPEIAVQANLKHVPIIQLQPDGLIANQISQLVKIVQGHMG
jgi:CheY-like chemotaxis protein/MinD-like ATPase involved in chromosome partitioning or flagellar assembly